MRQFLLPRKDRVAYRFFGYPVPPIGGVIRGGLGCLSGTSKSHSVQEITNLRTSLTICFTGGILSGEGRMYGNIRAGDGGVQALMYGNIRTGDGGVQALRRLFGGGRRSVCGNSCSHGKIGWHIVSLGTQFPQSEGLFAEG